FPTNYEWFIIVLLGLFSTYAQIYMTKAFSFAKAGIVGTISYSNIVFSIILGLFVGDSFPSFIIVLGIILIVISGFLVSKK
ncbi:EamA family transporter, partial [Aliarcobacter lanthieri]